MLNIELGGGIYPREGYKNLDQLDCADHKIDLEAVGAQRISLPFDDQSVDNVYSSHCFEHLRYLKGLWHEMTRILKDGGTCEIRVPHWAQSMAMCVGHYHALSEAGIIHLYEFADNWWDDNQRWLALERVQYVPNINYQEARECFPQLSPLQTIRFIQDTCHESRFIFKACKRSDPQTIIHNLVREVM